MKQQPITPSRFIMEPNFGGAAFEAEKTSKKFLFKLRNWLVSIAAIATIIGLLIIGVNAYKYATPPNNLDDIKLIRGALGPVRVEPVDPGGARFSFQDKLVYKNLEEQSSQSVQDNAGEVLVKEKVELRGTNKPQKTKIEKAPSTVDASPKASQETPKPKAKSTNNPFELLNE